MIKINCDYIKVVSSNLKKRNVIAIMSCTFTFFLFYFFFILDLLTFKSQYPFHLFTQHPSNFIDENKCLNMKAYLKYLRVKNFVFSLFFPFFYDNFISIKKFLVSFSRLLYLHYYTFIQFTDSLNHPLTDGTSF